MAFCAVNLIYIPGAFLVKPNVSDIVRQGLVPNFPGGFSGELFFFLMANIGTTIAPWMLFFQQSSVKDKGTESHRHPLGQIRHLRRRYFHGPGGCLRHHRDRDHALRSRRIGSRAGLPGAHGDKS